MSVCYDLHSHSTASDGTLSPSALVERAVAAGVNVLALTDHDTLDGLEEAAEAVNGSGLGLVPGVEMSVSWHGATIHVLGLGVDPSNQDLLEGLAGLQEFRRWRAEEIGRRLEKNGVPDALQGAERYRKGRIVARTHFARYLVESGRAASMNEVFKRYLVKGKPGYVRGEWATLEQALGWIRGAGGLAAVAHPARYRMTRSKLKSLLGEFRELGGVGLEVVSGSHSLDETNHMAAVSREHGLFASCGSDFHGPENSWIELGRLRRMPRACVPIWEAESWPDTTRDTVSVES